MAVLLNWWHCSSNDGISAHMMALLLKYKLFIRKLFFSKVTYNFFFQNLCITLDPDPKLGQNSGSGSKVNVSGSTTLKRCLLLNLFSVQDINVKELQHLRQRQGNGRAGRQPALQQEPYQQANLPNREIYEDVNRVENISDPCQSSNQSFSLNTRSLVVTAFQKHPGGG